MAVRNRISGFIPALVILVCLSACSSTPTEPDPFSWLYDRYQAHDYLVLSDSRTTFDVLAGEISAYYEAPLVHLDSLTTDEQRIAATLVEPDYMLIVVPPSLIDTTLVSQVFDLCSGLHAGQGEPFLDIAFGYITGFTVEEARALFHRTKTDIQTIGSYLGVSHVFDGDTWCHGAIQNYATRFGSVAWGTGTVIVNSDQWYQDPEGELARFQGDQLVCFIGHGSTLSICSLDVDELAGADFTRSLVFSGACYTGAVWADDPARSVSLKILSRGAANYASSIVGNGWMNMQYIVDRICSCRQSVGRSFVDGINREWAVYAPDNIQYIVLFGDPSFVPEFDTPVR